MSLGSYKPVFDEDLEKELCTCVIDMSTRFYGVTMPDLRSLTFELAEQNTIVNPCSKTQRLAGLSWERNCMNRHRELSLRFPEATSSARIT